MKPIGRRDPYTEMGIRRVPCFRCGEPAGQQWMICANGNRWVPLCNACDVKLNRLVLKFMGFPDVRERMAAYRNKLAAAQSRWAT